jgi:predicted transcriptional regulator
MKLAEIARTLDAAVLAGTERLEVEIQRCGASDLMSDILAGLAQDSLLLTGLATVQAVRTARIAGVGAVVFVRGKKPPPEAVAAAGEQGLPLLTCPHSMFVACGRLHALGLRGLNGNR